MDFRGVNAIAISWESWLLPAMFDTTLMTRDLETPRRTRISDGTSP